MAIIDTKIKIVMIVPRNADENSTSYHMTPIPINENNTNGTINPLKVSSSSLKGKEDITHLGNLDLVMSFIILLCFLFNFYFVVSLKI